MSADDFRALFGRTRPSRFIAFDGVGLPQQASPVGYDIVDSSGFIADDSVDSDQIVDGALTSIKFATGIVPPEVVTSLPTLPDTDYPQGKIVFLTTDQKLYRNTTGSAWSKATDGADITANSITAGQIAAAAIGVSELAADAVTATAIAADAVEADAIAAGAVEAEKIAVGAVDPTKFVGDSKNLAPNPSFEIVNGLSGTTFDGKIPGWPDTTSPVNFAFRGDGNTAFVHWGHFSLYCLMPGTPAQQNLTSEKFPIQANRRYRVGGYLSGNAANSGTAAGSLRVLWYDYSGAAIGSSVAVGSVQTVGTAQTFAFHPTATLTAPTTAVYASIICRMESTSGAGDIVYFDDLEFQLADQDVNHASGTVVIDSSGVAITNGALTVTNASSTVIIDGSSNMFKIKATGTASVAFPAAPGASPTRATISGTGSSVLAFIWNVGVDNSSTANLRATGWAIVSDNGGHTNWRSYGYVDISGGNNRITLQADSFLLNPGTTAMGRYYLLIEAGI